MKGLDGCQIPGYQRVSIGVEEIDPNQPLVKRLKRRFSRPWNYTVKPFLKKQVRSLLALKADIQSRGKTSQAVLDTVESPRLAAGDLVQVRSREEIEATLDLFKELRGCAFLEGMWQYCGTTQRVLNPVTRFLDERDYKVKKARSVVLLQGVLCEGTPVFGRCDRACHLFWREEWLIKLPEGTVAGEGGDG